MVVYSRKLVNQLACFYRVTPSISTIPTATDTIIGEWKNDGQMDMLVSMPTTITSFLQEMDFIMSFHEVHIVLMPSYEFMDCVFPSCFLSSLMIKCWLKGLMRICLSYPWRLYLKMVLHPHPPLSQLQLTTLGNMGFSFAFRSLAQPSPSLPL